MFYVNAGNQFGLGHFYRSLSVAKQLSLDGNTIHFVSKKTLFWENQQILIKGFSHIYLEDVLLKDYAVINKINVLYIDTLEDLKDLDLKTIKTFVTIIIYQNFSKHVKFADIFIAPNISLPNDIIALCLVNNIKLFNGLEYVLFSEKVRNLKKANFKQRVSKIGISVGGSDPHNCLMYLLKIFLRNDFFGLNCEFNFFVPTDYQHLLLIPDRIPNFVRFMDFDFQEIVEQDIIITAFGVSVFEYLYLGIPVICFGHSLENTKSADILTKNTGALENLGFLFHLNDYDLERTLKLMKDNYSIRLKMSEIGLKLIDASGLNNVVKILENV